MKKSLNVLAKTISDKIDHKNIKDVASALWFELQLQKKTGQLDYILNRIRQNLAQKDKEQVAQVISSEALDEKTLSEIKERLEKKYDSKIQLLNVVDQSILGGIKIQIQDKLIDLSWREKLNSLKTRMAG